MNLITQHFNKENLHHAYLIEGESLEIIPELFAFLKSIGVATNGNPDFCQITLDALKIDDARNLKSLTAEKNISEGKKIFVLSVNNILLEAQNTLLKIFEEPAANTHFFIIIPSTDNLLRTLISRFYLIKTKENIDLKEAEDFIKMPPRSRIDFIKELLSETEEEDDESVVKTDSARAKALRFLNALEKVLHEVHLSKGIFYSKVFEHIMKVRKYLAQPGSSAKMLLESVALMIPCSRF